MSTTTTTISEKGLLLAEERHFWQDVEAISRTFRDKKVHAYAKKMIKWIGRAMIEVARDQMEEDDDEETTEEQIKKLVEEDKLPPSEKIRKEAMMNAWIDSEWGSGF